MKSTERIAKFFQKKRVESGLSQKEVSKALGYKTPQFISNWERGLSTPPLSAVRKLTKIYKLDIDEVYRIVLRETIDYETSRIAKILKKT